MRISDWSSDVCSSDLRYIAGCSESLWLATGEQIAIGRPLARARAARARGPSGRSAPMVRQLVLSGFLTNKVPTWPFPRERLPPHGGTCAAAIMPRSEEHTSELQSLMRISYAVFCLKNKNRNDTLTHKKREHNRQI